MNIDRNCLTCNKTMNLSKNSTKNFCSVKCLRQKTQKVCRTCQKPFNGKNQFYCSFECRILKSKNKQCKVCNQNFIPNRNRSIICSKECNKEYLKSLSKIAIRKNRSKLETQLSNNIKIRYPKLIVIDNDRNVFQGLEIDIWLPELKLAIEWNGPLHYKPIFGTELLYAQQDRDNRKLLLSNQLDINLMVIPACDAINKKQFQIIQDEVFNVIDSILSLTINEGLSPA